METISELLALCEGNPPVTGGFPSQRPVTGNFDGVFFDNLRLNKRLRKQSRRRWFETPSRSSLRKCNDLDQSHNTNTLVPGRCGGNLKSFNFRIHVTDKVHEHFWNCSPANIIERLLWYVNVGPGNDSMPSGVTRTQWVNGAPMIKSEWHFDKFVMDFCQDKKWRLCLINNFCKGLNQLCEAMVNYVQSYSHKEKGHWNTNTFFHTHVLGNVVCSKYCPFCPQI